ncbi:MAG: nitroreductase [Gammaproteobacteria bacterium]|nr:nitroreductase [Gammaproteobacteria bacterium]
MHKIIKERRSCRDFDPERVVEREKIEEIVNAGLNAPTAKGTQDGIIVAITNKEFRDKIVELNAEVRGKDGDPFYGAPVILLVAVKKGRFVPYDGSCMIENMMLEAVNQGLDTCWIHRAKEELESIKGLALFKLVGIDLTEYEGVGHVALGYSKSNEFREKTIKDNRVFWVE